MPKLFKVPECFYKPKAGQYGLVGSDAYAEVDWVACREEFEECGNPRKFLFCALKGESRAIRRFLDDAQDRIKLPKRDRLKVLQTNTPTVILIKTGKFWRNEVRLSLLTCLLRVGKYYKGKNNFWDTINKFPYLAETEDAVAWFLMGNTVYQDKDFDFEGWLTTFEDISLRQLEKILKKPNRRRNKV